MLIRNWCCQNKTTGMLPVALVQFFVASEIHVRVLVIKRLQIIRHTLPVALWHVDEFVGWIQMNSSFDSRGWQVESADGSMIEEK